MSFELEFGPPSPELQARLDRIRADYYAGRDADDPWSDEDLGGR